LFLFTSSVLAENPIPSRVVELKDEPAELVTQIGDVLDAMKEVIEKGTTPEATD